MRLIAGTVLLHAVLAAPGATEELRVHARYEWTTQELGDIATDPVKTRIVIHHTAHSVTDAEKRLTGEPSWRAAVKHAQEAQSLHTHIRGWKDIGYHFMIDWEGRVLEGRPLDLLGAHVEKHNTGSIGIVLMGNFTRQRPTAKQVSALRSLLNRLMKENEITPKDISGHYQMKSTICPGTYLNNVWDAGARPIAPVQLKPRPKSAR